MNSTVRTSLAAVALLAGWSAVTASTGLAQKRTVWDGEIDANATLDLAIPAGWRTEIAVLHGDLRVADRAVPAPAVVCLSDAGTAVRLSAGDRPARFLVLTGEPIDEPIAQLGPFVMNTRAELERAVFDFRSGAMGVM